MKREAKSQMKKGYVGIDAGKRTLELCRLHDDNSIDWNRTKTDEAGIARLLQWLKKNDVVALEAGNQAFRIAKFIKTQIGCEVYVLNPGDLAVIYRSLKKTDKEDALKLARLISRIPPEELPVVPVPSDDIEDARRLLKEQEYWTKQITIAKNRLHSLFAQAGITHIKKKHLSSVRNRKSALELLSERFIIEAGRTNSHMIYLEEKLKIVRSEIQETLGKDVPYMTIAMSMPGVGPITALSFYAYLEDCRRFNSPGQVSYYAGLVPRVHMSGDTVHYGRIIKRHSHLLRRPLIQAAWALVRSKHGGHIKAFYERLYTRIGKKKAIVATARKMVEVFYVMIRTGGLYDGVPTEVINKKLAHYAVI